LGFVLVGGFGAVGPEVAEVGAAKEFDSFGVVGGGGFFEGFIDGVKGAPQGGIAPDWEFFRFGHSQFFHFRHVNVFGIHGVV
jgi:hypothetical protein